MWELVGFVTNHSNKVALTLDNFFLEIATREMRRPQDAISLREREKTLALHFSGPHFLVLIFFRGERILFFFKGAEIMAQFSLWMLLTAKPRRGQ